MWEILSTRKNGTSFFALSTSSKTERISREPLEEKPTRLLLTSTGGNISDLNRWPWRAILSHSRCSLIRSECREPQGVFLLTSTTSCQTSREQPGAEARPSH